MPEFLPFTEFLFKDGIILYRMYIETGIYESDNGPPGLRLLLSLMNNDAPM